MKTELAKEFAADVDVPKVVKLFADAILTRKRELERDAGQVDGPKLN